MSITEVQETKSNLKAWIDQLSDNNMLSMLDGLRASNSDKISWEDLSESQRENITEGLKDIENGRVMTSEEFGTGLKMNEESSLKIRYSERALANIKGIKRYLLYHFTQKEVDNMYGLLYDFEDVVKVFPDLHPLILNGKKMRRAVLNKKLSVFYTFSKNTISITSVLDNRMDTSKWPR